MGFLRRSIALMLAILVLSSSILTANVYGKSVDKEQIYLTLEASCNMAVENSRDINKIQKTLDGLWEQYGEVVNTRMQIQSQLDAMDNYKRLYEKRQKNELLDPLEDTQLLRYSYIYGFIPPVISPEDMFNRYIKGRDFPTIELSASMDNLRRTRDILAANVESGVTQIYSSLLGLYDTLSIQEELYNVMQKQYKQLLARYELGQVSEYERYSSETSLTQQFLSIGKLERTIENMEMNFKRQVGLKIDDKIELANIAGKEEVFEAFKIQDYREIALKNRLDIMNAAKDYNVKQSELAIMKEYIRDEYSKDRIEAEIAAEEKSIALKEIKDKAITEVNNYYEDTIFKLKAVIIAKSKLKNTSNQYNQMNVQYELGLIPLSSLWDVQFSCYKANVAYQGAIRDYNMSVDKLETVSNLRNEDKVRLGV